MQKLSKTISGLEGRKSSLTIVGLKGRKQIMAALTPLLALHCIYFKAMKTAYSFNAVTEVQSLTAQRALPGIRTAYLAAARPQRRCTSCQQNKKFEIRTTDKSQAGRLSSKVSREAEDPNYDCSLRRVGASDVISHYQRAPCSVSPAWHSRTGASSGSARCPC